jgi:hypothetical protein
LHCNPKTCECEKTFISIGEEFEVGCDDYECFLETEEYRHKFYIAVKTDDNKVARAVDFGKKVELNGRVFFTKERIMEDESHTVTDKRTGLLARSISWLKDNWEKFLELEKKVVDVESLPLAVKECGVYHIVDEQKGGDTDDR